MYENADKRATRMCTCKTLAVAVMSHCGGQAGGARAQCICNDGGAARGRARRRVKYIHGESHTHASAAHPIRHNTSRSAATRKRGTADAASHTPEKTQDGTAPKRCGNAGATLIKAQHPRTSAAKRLRQPRTHTQHRNGVAQCSLQHKNTQTAAAENTITHTRTSPNTRNHAIERRRTLTSCPARTGGVVSNLCVRCAACVTRAPPSGTIPSWSAGISARPIRCEESEKK
jgi:hypothetical protein